MKKIYSLNVDVVFKIFISRKINIACLLMSKILGRKISEKDVRVRPTIFNPNFVEGKTIISDSVFELKDASIVFMEMQQKFHKFFLSRIEYYLAKLLQDQLKKGINYDSLKPVYGIFFVNTTLEFPRLFTKTSIFDNIDASGSLMNAIIINLRYLNKESDLDKDLESIFKFMKASTNEEMEYMGNDDKLAKEIYEELKKISADASYKQILDILERDELDRNSINKEEVDTGRAEGRAEAIKENNIKMIINLYKSGQTINFISEVVEISIEEIEKVLKEYELI